MKRLLSKGIITMLLISSINATAFADLKNSDVNFFLEKIATTEDSTNKAIGIELIKQTIIERDKPDVELLKDSIESITPKEYKDKLQEKGYTMSEALSSLDVLEKMSKNDVEKLIKAMENEDLSSIKSIVNSYNDSDKSESSGSAGSGSSAVEDKAPVVEQGKVNIKFKDLESHWAKDDIAFLVDKGIVKGQTEDKFNPDGKISRAEFTALIIRLLDIKEINSAYTIKFKDVNNTDWFYSTVKIGKEFGIINGIDEESFSPNQEITREEMVTIIMRALEKSNINNISKNADIKIDQFNDKDIISNWALDNVSKSLEMGIIKGKSENAFDAKGMASRGEAATIIKRVFDLIKK